ncbi:bifunctional hydroxymethylpyrimidine kinase/phosphomethylpyrimidine kinase [Tautonia sociabilis]|uniref:hydroxymethylpyrimidine kinase n=1 Tax=Tautonia sociabilis TaxID=2080755 RepID=A0A432MMP5_9BACT|nr:bifunctional hydroxymethylpyrimidine kinase/phosphomethylpyrimidine kinase [Tautonia sociabilis]RUL88713.1 bifunctional hydroxymethylpyrimidine kinase/phosphomethylpyrimidine kinase [Tautonia sociabilis]
MPEQTACLTIAGSDPSGGAGIQADLKTFAALGTYGAAAITALTAQNTTGVQGVELVDPAFVAQQVESVFDDLPVASVKTGMLGSAAIIAAVADAIEAQLDRTPELRVVVDPVMVARSGDPLLDPKAVLVLRDRLLPLASVVTPNRHEASLLTGTGPIESPEDLRRTAFALFELVGHRPVLVKGGQALAGALDLLIDGHGAEFPLAIPGAPIVTRSTHGAGCTLSAAIAALLAKGHSLRESCAGAKRFVFGAIEHAPGLGRGNGPLDHLWLRRIDEQTRVREREED